MEIPAELFVAAFVVGLTGFMTWAAYITKSVANSVSNQAKTTQLLRTTANVVGRLDDKVDEHSERLVRVETTLGLNPQGGQ